MAYHARMVKFYWRLPTSPISEMFSVYNLGMGDAYYSYMVAVFQLTFCGLHGFSLVHMLKKSIHQRRAVFFKETSRPDQDEPTKKSCFQRFLGRDGLFGVEGKYFDVGLLIIEIAETLLQSYQAYRVSRFITRRWVNRLYVCTITLSCWAIVAIHFVYRNHASKRRLMCLMFDCVLDLVSAIFLPGTIFYIYLQDYDPVSRTITRWRWYDDIWLVSIWSEYHLVLADSWLNLLNRLAFSFGLLVGMQGVKELLRSRPPKVRPSMARRLSDRMTKLFTQHCA